jgi:hypothetical protein
MLRDYFKFKRDTSDNTSYFVAENYGPYLKTNFFQTKILPPVISWKTNQALPVANVQRNGNILSWSASQTDGSFVIFAVPREFTPGSITGFDYMLTRHWTKNNTFDLSNYNNLLSSHGFAVAYVNRFETMSTPVYEYDIISADVASVKSTFHAYAEGGKLNLTVYQPENVVIYSAGGIVVYQGMVQDKLIVDLPRGVYLVRVKSEIKKIIL